MNKKNLEKSNGNFFENVAVILTRFTGSTVAFIGAIAIVILWAVTGPLFNYSEGWQLVINTGTTIITFIMVFVIQRSQNKDSVAIHLKLNELIASMQGASNRLIDAEDMSEKELEVLKTHFKLLSNLYKNDYDILASHSIEEAQRKHSLKLNPKSSR